MQQPNLQVTSAATGWLNRLLKQAKDEGDDVSVKETITPEYASALLARNPANRNLRLSKLAQYESDMREGRFVYNGETIIVSPEGMLNDGQHRLWACVNSGVPFRTRLVVGVPRATRTTIDTGATKGPSDFLSFDGYQNTGTASAIARYILTWSDERNLSKRSQISSTAIIDLVQKDDLLREIAAWVDAQKYRFKNMVKGSIVGFSYYLFAQVAPKEAHDFMTQFREGSMLSQKSPIYLLREKFRTDTKLTDMQKVEAMIRAWNHWCHNTETSISRLQLMGTIPDIATPKYRVA